MQLPHRQQPGDPPSRRRHAAVIAMLVLAVLLVGLDTLVWFRLEHALDRRLDGFVGDARAAGWRFRAQPGGRGGWPLAATLTLIRPSLRGAAPSPSGGIDWSGDSVTLSLSLLHPHRAVVLADGTQTVTVAPGSLPSTSVRFWAARISLRLPDPHDPVRDGWRLHADALHVGLAGTGPDDIVQVAELTARLRWRRGIPSDTDTGKIDVASLSLFLRDIALPARLAVGDRTAGARIVQQARLEASLSGRLSGASSIAAGLSRWQRSGGRLQVGRAGFEWGGSQVTLAGTASLRPDGLAEGAFTLDAVDVVRALRQMRDVGLVGAGTGQAMQAVLGLVAAAEPGPHLRLPLVLTDGMLGLGEIPLLRLPRVPLAAP